MWWQRTSSAVQLIARAAVMSVVSKCRLPFCYRSLVPVGSVCLEGKAWFRNSDMLRYIKMTQWKLTKEILKSMFIGSKRMEKEHAVVEVKSREGRLICGDAVSNFPLFRRIRTWYFGLSDSGFGILCFWISVRSNDGPSNVWCYMLDLGRCQLNVKSARPN